MHTLTLTLTLTLTRTLILTHTLNRTLNLILTLSYPGLLLPPIDFLSTSVFFFFIKSQCPVFVVFQGVWVGEANFSILLLFLFFNFFFLIFVCVGSSFLCKGFL